MEYEDTDLDTEYAGLDDAMQELDINEDDLVIINKDGSYVVLPTQVAEILMSDANFANKVDIGFDDIDDFTSVVSDLYQNLDIGDNSENN